MSSSSSSSTSSRTTTLTSSPISPSPPHLPSIASVISSQDEMAGQDQPSRVDFNPNGGYNLQLHLSAPSFYVFLNQKEFICGFGSAMINTFVTFPINKLIFRQQLHGISGHKAFSQVRKEGVRFLYRGLLPPLLQKTTSISIMFGVYTRTKKVLQDAAPTLSPRSLTVLSALAAGTLEASLSPFERVQTLMQSKMYHNKFSNSFDAFRCLFHYGPAEYYRGLSVIILRNGPSNSLFFLGREYLKVNEADITAGQKITRDFVSGACLGASISTLFFPMNVMKTHMQAQLGGPFWNIWRTFKNVLAEREGKIRNLYKGVHLNYTRSFLAWGIINASYELLIKCFKYEQERRRL